MCPSHHTAVEIFLNTLQKNIFFRLKEIDLFNYMSLNRANKVSTLNTNEGRNDCLCWPYRMLFPEDKGIQYSLSFFGDFLRRYLKNLI